MRLTLSFLFLLALPLPATGQERPPRPSRPAAPRPPVAPLPPLGPALAPLPSLEWNHDLGPDFPDAPFLLDQFGGDLHSTGWGDALAPTVQRSHGIPVLRPEQGTREDSLFRAAREALNRGEYQRASDLFRSFEKDFPRSRSASAALYWQAFALYRIGTQARLEEARAALQAVRDRYAEAAQDSDVTSLLLRVQGALAARGDAQAAARVRAAAGTGNSCDKEEMAVRAEAMNALVQSDATAAGPVLERVLARRDECSVALRRRAVYLLGRTTTDPEGTTRRMIEVFRTDPDRQVQSDALSLVGRQSGSTALQFLGEVARTDADLRVRRAAIRAISGQENPEANAALLGMIGDMQLETSLRAAAIASFASSGGRYTVSGGRAMGSTEDRIVATGSGGGVARADAPVIARYTARGGSAEQIETRSAFLRDLYGSLTDPSLTRATLQALGRLGGEANTRWLLDLARNPQAPDADRSTALSQVRSSDLTASQLSQLYDGLTSRSMRRSVINLLGRRNEPEATDKLIEIARSGTDPESRRAAISALARKNDPRATQLLLELVEK